MNRRVGLLRLNGYYLLGGVMFLTLGYQLQTWHFELGLLVTELVLVLGLALWIIKSSGAAVGDYLWFQEVKAPVLIKTGVIALLSLPVVLVLNLTAMLFLEIGGGAIMTEMPQSNSFQGAIFQFFIISMVAGIAEEVLFRGVFLQAYRDYFKDCQAVFFSGLLFALFHFNLQNFLGPLYLGIVFGILTVKTRSIIPAILGHMLNNGIAYVLSFMAAMMPEETGAAGFGVSEILETILSMAFTAALALGLVVWILRSIKGGEEKDEAGLKPVGRFDFLPIMMTLGIYVVYGALVFFRS
jgi:hypothetical protein